MSTHDIEHPAFVSPGWPPSAFQNGIVSYVAAMLEGCQGLRVEPLVLTENMAAGHEDDAVVLVPKEDMAATHKRLMARCFRERFRMSSFRRRMVPILHRLAKSNRVGLLEMEESFGLAYGLLKDSPVPIVTRLHGPWFLNGEANGVPRDTFFFKRIKAEGRLIAAADGVSAPSLAVLSAVREYYGLPLLHAAVVPYPTSEAPNKFIWRAGDGESRLILFVGRFDRHKGGDLLIQAFRLIAEKVPGAKLVFAGPDRGISEAGGNSTTLESYAQEHLGQFAQPPHFSWLGAVAHDELAELRKQAAIVVVASRYENFPMVLLEALSQGCPIVASDAGGIPEIVQDEKNGLLFRCGDAEDLAAKIETLLRHPDLAARLGQEAHETWRRKYQPRMVAEEMMGFYREVLQTYKGSMADRRSRRRRLWKG